MHLETVLTQMKSMRLSAMATALETRLKANDHAGLSHEEFIALLVHDEWEARENRKLTRMISQANLKPQQACLENIRYDDSRGFTKPQVVEFRSDTWIRNARNLIITGATGSGKTFIAEAIALQACRLGFPSMKKRYRMILEEVRESKGVGTYLKYLQKWDKMKVMVIDDFLMDDSISAEDLNTLMDLIERREQIGSIIVTTQYPVDVWHSLMPDPTVADAVCDRLLHGSTIINLKGESMRKKNKNP